MHPPRTIGNRELTLVAFLATRARGASDGRLAVHAGVGLVAAVVALLTRPPLWLPLVLLALALGAFGAWGIADRELGERQAAGRAQRGLRLVRDAVAVAGALAAIAAALLLFFGALGTWTL